MRMRCLMLGTSHFRQSRTGLNSYALVSLPIFLILIAAAISFALPVPDPALINPNADSRSDDNDDAPTISASSQHWITCVHPTKDTKSGEVKTDGPQARATDDQSEADNDVKGSCLAQCDGHDEKPTTVSKPTAADNDDDDDDDNDWDGNQVKSSDPKPVPGIEFHFDSYRDTDGNLTVTAGSIATSLLGDTLLQMRKDQVMAHDGLGGQRIESTLLTATEKPSEGLTVTGALGTIRALTWQSAVGGVKATQTMGDLSVTLNAAREMVGGTAQAIREHVMREDLGLYLYNDFTDHLSGEASFHHYIYSDGNRSDQALLSPQYEISLRRSQLAFGYAFTYRSFAQTADRGYSSPRRLLSNDLTALWKFDRGDYYGNVEASGGHVLIAGPASGQGATGSGMGESSVATLGVRFTKSSRLETYWSDELYPGWSSTGFGFRIWYDF